jgi:AcrR family transcriptional regulator
MESADAGERRRIRREELNRSLILDAAEQTFAEHGYKGASLREITRKAGFSAAAVYLFFDSKQHLYGETLVRRGAELREAMEQAGRTSLPALQRLHEMADVAIAYYRHWPNFARLVAQAHAMMLGSSLTAWEEHPDPQVREQYQRAMALETEIIREGQRSGDIRPGDPRALAHLYSVIVNTFLAVGASSEEAGMEAATSGLTAHEMHEIIDGAFRALHH